MKFTLSWLKEFLTTDAAASLIAETLTAIGLEVENVTDNAGVLRPFIAARIEDAQPHPNADKLRVCRVDDGATIRQVVCGAPNARAGIKVVLATEGTVIPASGMTIKKSSIRQVESNGMLCSSAELGLNPDGAGIIELPQDAVLGQSIVDVLGLDDTVFDIAVTPNRADALGIYGIARDLAAAGVGTLTPYSVTPHSPKFTSALSVHLETPACPLFAGYPIKGVKNGPSPEWLQRHLKSVGLRPISALVDITNFMTMAYGRPLHVFDAGKLKGGIAVRYARDGESLKALDGKEYTLTPSMIAVCDDTGVVGLGGVMGGQATGCDETTTEVLLESALFDPVHVAATGRALGIESDARYRFERGVDPAFVITGAEIAVALIIQCCGGVAGEPMIAGSAPPWRRRIDFNPEKVASLGGLMLPSDRIDSILADLGFEKEQGKIVPPSWRADIDGEASLVEEVLRIAGYDCIAAVPLPRSAAAEPAPHVKRAYVLRKVLATQGLTEISSWAFVAQDQAVKFGGGRESLMLLNPINSDLGAMRPNLLPHLLAAVARNAARGLGNVALFEMGNVFEDVGIQGQKAMAAGVRAAKAESRSAYAAGREVDVFDAKSDLFAVLDACGLNAGKLAVDRTVPAWYHPARSGRLSLGGKITLGFFGEIHPSILSDFDIKHRVVAFEVHLDAVPFPKAKGSGKAAFAVSNFQAVERDFAFLAEERLPASGIVKAIEGVEKHLIRSAEIFDVFTGKGIAPGKKSIAVSVTLQAQNRTLTDTEIEAVSQKILTAAAGLGLVLRA